MTLLRPVCVAILFGVAATPVSADSDGYYCIGRNYLAYQFGMAGPSAVPHNLYIVRFDASQGIAEPVMVPLPQFQVHGMRCRDGGVDVASFDSVYSVSFDGSGRVVDQTTVMPLRGSGHLPAWAMPQRNLTTLSSAARIPAAERHVLMRRENDREIVLEITAKPDDSAPCRTSIVTRLIEVDAESRETAEYVIFRGTGFRECGGAALETSSTMNDPVMNAQPDGKLKLISRRRSQRERIA